MTDSGYEWITDASGRLLRVHTRKTCGAWTGTTTCPIHAPSDHPLNTAPLLWRDDRRIMERVCEHGVGHPDPDDRKVRSSNWEAVHGCDGCCEGAGPAPRIGGDQADAR